MMTEQVKETEVEVTGKLTRKSLYRRLEEEATKRGFTITQESLADDRIAYRLINAYGESFGPFTPGETANALGIPVSE